MNPSNTTPHPDSTTPPRPKVTPWETGTFALLCILAAIACAWLWNNTAHRPPPETTPATR